MWLEAFVITMCLGRFECSETPRAYYLYNKDLQALVATAEENGKKLAGPIIVNYVVPYAMPFAFIATGRKASVKLDRNWAYEMGPDGFMLKWSMSY